MNSSSPPVSPPPATVSPSQLLLHHSPSIKNKILGPTAFDQLHSPPGFSKSSSIRDSSFSFRNLPQQHIPQRTTSIARNGSIVARGPDAHTLHKVDSIKKIAETDQRRRALAALSSNENPPSPTLSSFNCKRTSVPIQNLHLPGPVKPLNEPPSILAQQNLRFMNSSYKAQESIISRNSDPFPHKSHPIGDKVTLRATVSQDINSPLEQERSTTSICSSFSEPANMSPIPSTDITPPPSSCSRLSMRNRVGFGSVEFFPAEGCLSDSFDALLSVVPSRRLLQRQDARGRHDETFAEVSSKLLNLSMLEPKYKNSSFHRARQSLNI